MKPQETDAEIKYLRKFRRFVPTKYDELTVFLQGLASVLFLLSDHVMRREIYHYLVGQEDYMAWVFVIAVLIGFGVATYHVFSFQDKTDDQNYMMLLAGVAINVTAAWVASKYVLQHPLSFYAIFPLWNFSTALLLMFLFMNGIINSEEDVKETDASRWQVISGTVLVLLGWAICRYIFSMYWAIGLSVCITYISYGKRFSSQIASRILHVNEKEEVS